MRLRSETYFHLILASRKPKIIRIGSPSIDNGCQFLFSFPHAWKKYCDIKIHNLKEDCQKHSSCLKQMKKLWNEIEFGFLYFHRL